MVPGGGHLVPPGTTGESSHSEKFVSHVKIRASLWSICNEQARKFRQVRKVDKSLAGNVSYHNCEFHKITVITLLGLRMADIKSFSILYK